MNYDQALTKAKELDIEEMFLSLKEDSYEFYLAVSTDTLLVLDNKKEFVEVVIYGNDNDGNLLGFNCQDDLLDAIVIFKEYYKRGYSLLLAI